MKKIYIIPVIILTVLISFLLYNYLSNPLLGCEKTSSSLGNTFYRCGDRNIWVQDN